jgi:VWFA-related protein
MRRLTLIILLILTSGLSFSEEPIRVNVKLVNVAFSARDSSGALVSSLTKDDVEVFEDAVQQKISFFAHSVDVPLTLGLIVDFSGSQDQFSKQHQHDLEVFLKDILGPKDRVFLIGFGNHLRLISDFSQSGPELMDRLKLYPAQQQALSGAGAERRSGLGHRFLRFHLLLGD